MKIDRHNYEEFFLLYVDNELSQEQRKSVDQFIQENPDLAIELEILQQTTLTADESIVFDGKASLLKTGADSLINLSNYEEYLISYIDNELSDAERMEFFKFAMAHPQVKEELAIYQQTKLQPEEEIVFANKQVLYRKEEKVKVITLQWWKIAVAAAVILAAGVTTIKVMNGNKPAVEPTVAATGKNTEKNNTVEKTNTDTKKDDDTSLNETQTSQDTKDNVENIAAANDQKKKEKINTVKRTNEEKVQQKSVEPRIEKNDESIAAIKKDKKSDDIKTDIAVNTKAFDAIKKSDEPAKPNAIAVNTSIPKENINSKPVTPATDEPLDVKEITQDNTNSSPDYASYDEGKNKKLRGFFRKASRVFERRTNISAADEEEKQDKLLIGGLAVKLK